MNDRSRKIAGRAARNVNGLVIMYADDLTESMQRTIDETNRRREKQLRYNAEHGIIPKTILKSREQILKQSAVLDIRPIDPTAYVEPEEASLVADPVRRIYVERSIAESHSGYTKNMERAAKEMEFMEAAKFRDEMFALENRMKEKFN